MKRTRNGYTRKQYAYAQNVLHGVGTTKKEAALVSGYSPAVAHSVVQKIESTEGFSNAMSALASETGNVALQVLHTLKHRDLSKEPTQTLLNAVNTLANAWERFTPKEQKNLPDKGSNRLRAILLEPTKTHDAIIETNEKHLMSENDYSATIDKGAI